MVRITTDWMILEGRMLERGHVVAEQELGGLAEYFLSLGLIETEEESAQITPPRSALAWMLETFMPPTANA